MLAFEPKSGKHAVAELAIGIYYNSTLNGQAIEKAKARRAEYKEFLPVESPVAGFQVNMSSGAPNVSQIIQEGFLWQRMKSDGTVGWQISVQEDRVVVNCLEYTNWDQVWAKMSRWLLDMHQQIIAGGHTATAFSLQFIDQFSRKQPVTRHILRELFSTESKFLPRRFFENSELWHVHQGWFEEAPAPLKGKKLNVINLGANRIGPHNTVTLDHLMRVNLAADSPPLLTTEIEGSALETALGALHNENKHTVSDILSPEAAKAIGLVD